MKFHNYMEDIVLNMMDKILPQRDDICKCEKCKLDIVALVLNKLPPKYVVTSKGVVYTRLAQLKIQLKADLAKEITQAISIVQDKPQH